MRISERKVGSSKTLNKTITEIMGRIGDNGCRPSTGLRKFLHIKLDDLVANFYNQGIKRGHRGAHKLFVKNGKVPREITFRTQNKLLFKQRRKLIVKSKLSSAKA